MVGSRMPRSKPIWSHAQGELQRLRVPRVEFAHRDGGKLGVGRGCAHRGGAGEGRRHLRLSVELAPPRPVKRTMRRGGGIARSSLRPEHFPAADGEEDLERALTAARDDEVLRQRGRAQPRVGLRQDAPRADGGRLPRLRPAHAGHRFQPVHRPVHGEGGAGEVRRARETDHPVGADFQLHDRRGGSAPAARRRPTSRRSPPRRGPFFAR